MQLQNGIIIIKFLSNSEVLVHNNGQGGVLCWNEQSLVILLERNPLIYLIFNIAIQQWWYLTTTHWFPLIAVCVGREVWEGEVVVASVCRVTRGDWLVWEGQGVCSCPRSQMTSYEVVGVGMGVLWSPLGFESPSSWGCWWQVPQGRPGHSWTPACSSLCLCQCWRVQSHHPPLL